VQSVAVGQNAMIKFPGLTSRQAPTFSGAVKTISADSVTDETTKETYFSATVAVDRASIPKEWIDKITPGMPADVLITTGERTAFNYLIGPLKDSLSKAMHER
jgi:HlyD family secretion protein